MVDVLANSWRVSVEVSAETDKPPRFCLANGTCSIPLEGDAELNEVQQGLLYSFSEQVVQSDSFWVPLLHEAVGRRKDIPSDLSVRFIGNLRETLSGVRARDQLERLSFELATLEGRLAHTEQRIAQLLGDAIGMDGIDTASPSYEDKILGIVTGRDKRWKAAVSDRISKRVIMWLVERGAADRLRTLFRALPIIFRADVTRVTLISVVLLYGTIFAKAQGSILNGALAFSVTAALLMFVVWTCLAPLLSRARGRWAIALRPAFELRWQSLAVMAWVAASGLFVGRLAEVVSGAGVVVVLLGGIGSAGWYWRRFCGRHFGVDSHSRAIVNRRARILLALNIEEALAISIAVDAITGLITLPVANEEVANNTLALFGLQLPRCITVDLTVFSYCVRPPYIMVLIGLILISCWLVSMRRPRVPI